MIIYLFTTDVCNRVMSFFPFNSLEFIYILTYSNVETNARRKKLQLLFFIKTKYYFVRRVVHDGRTDGWRARARARVCIHG